MKNTVFWDVTPCGSCNRRFGRMYGLHKGDKNRRSRRFLSKRRFLQEPHSVTSMKTEFFIPVSNLSVTARNKVVSKDVNICYRGHMPQQAGYQRSSISAAA
jgi:hypothetical protein